MSYNRKPPYRVAVICTGNTARSQMGEGLINHFLSGKWIAYSAGTNPGKLNPRAVQVMAELGIDISNNQPKGIEALEGIELDLAVAVCEEGVESCPYVPGARHRFHIPVPDPSPYTDLPDEEALSHFRQAREQLRAILFPLLEEWEQRLSRGE